MFDTRIAQLAIRELKKKGVVFADGLALSELNTIKEELGAQLPPELELFLAEGVPISDKKGGYFPNWHANPRKIVAETRDDIENAVAFDIQANGYWHNSFGARPDGTDAAIRQAVAVMRARPPFIRVYGHRFMPTDSAAPGSPVLSIWQATDSIYYGYDFADYLQKEFDIKLPTDSAKSPRKVQYWGEVFGL